MVFYRRNFLADCGSSLLSAAEASDFDSGTSNLVKMKVVLFDTFGFPGSTCGRNYE
jgi:hypothetical protein